MPPAALLSPAMIAALLVPGWSLAAVIFVIGGAPGDWARTALTIWTVLAATLLAGGAISGGAISGEGAPMALLVLLAGFVAAMTGGPWGLVAAAVAACALFVVPSLIGPRWLALLLALPPAAAAVRQLFWR